MRDRSPVPPRIAIVGAGIAGLNAALTLADRGVPSTVYEASTRVGGRLYSNAAGYWDDGQVSEWSGELINTNFTTIRSLAERFGLELTDTFAGHPHGATDTYWFEQCGYYSAEQAEEDFRPVHDTLQAQLREIGYPTTYASHTRAGLVFDEMTVHDWIETYVDGGHGSPLGKLLDAAYNEEFGAESTDQSALNLIYLLGHPASPGRFEVYGESDERYHVAGGNDRIPQAIADQLGPGAVRLGWELEAVAVRAGGSVSLRFTTPDGAETVVADHVILCMSFSVLRTLDCSHAGFDALKRTAIDELGSGVSTKLQLQFTSRRWNERGSWGVSNGNVYTDNGFQNAWDSTAGAPGASGLLVDYAGGDYAASFEAAAPYATADEDPRVAEHARAWLARLETIFPGIAATWNGKATLSTPFRDPLLRCSYSYWRPGQCTRFGGYEGVPQGPEGQIHFAGEHCSVDFQGYMEGAARSGARAAGEVLAALRPGGRTR